MKIVFTATGKDKSSNLDMRFGRAQGFILLDEDTKKISWHSNEQNIEAAHGAGIQAGQTVIDLGAEVVITGGDFGPKAYDVLQKAGIKMHTNVGSISINEAYNK